MTALFALGFIFGIPLIIVPLVQSNNIITIVLLVLFIQSFLVVLGQPLDALWLCLKESKGFLFSISRHYF